MYMWNLSTYLSEEEKQPFSSFCSLRCAFGFPMTASCCLLLSPHPCLDSLRPPQEGKVDIYIEAFGMAISRRGFCRDPGSLLQKRKNIKTKEKQNKKLKTIKKNPPILVASKGQTNHFFFAFYKATSPKDPQTYLFYWTSLDAFLFNRSGNRFHIH